MIRLSPQQTSKVKIEDATFTIRPLTGADVLCVTCERGPGMKLLEAVKRGLVNWEGVNETDGHSAIYDGRIEGLPSHVLASLSNEIWNITHPSESDEKKSASVPQSSQGESPISASAGTSK